MSKSLDKEVPKLKKEVKNLKTKEASDAKESFEKELPSYKDQLASLQKSLDVERAAKEKAEKSVEEHIEKLKKEHAYDLVKARMKAMKKRCLVLSTKCLG